MNIQTIIVLLFALVYVNTCAPYPNMRRSVPTTPTPHTRAPEVRLETKKTWEDIYSLAYDAAVQVFVYEAISNIFEPFKAPEEGTSKGSAFFVRVNGEEGYLLTNFHVTEDALAAYIQVPSLGKEQFEVDVVRCRPWRDIALLKLTDAAQKDLESKLNGKLPAALELGDSDKVKKLETVMTMGYPVTEEGSKYTIGHISGKERIDGQYYLQITAPISWGSSGGPSFNDRGVVIGMNTRGHARAQNTNYMIPSNDIKKMLESTKNPIDGVIERRPFWGFSRSATHTEMYEYFNNKCTGGVFIRNVLKGSLFEKHGIQECDILYRVNGFDLDRHGYVQVPWSQDKVEFMDILDRLEAGEIVELVLDRQGEQINISFPVVIEKIFAIEKLFPRYEALDCEIIGGMVVMALTFNHIETIFAEYVKKISQGFVHIPNLSLMKFLDPSNRLEPCLFISNVYLNSQAHKKYVSPGTLITKVNDKDVRTLNEFREAVLLSKNERFLTIESLDNGITVFDVDQIVSQEDMLSKMHRFPKSPLVEQFR